MGQLAFISRSTQASLKYLRLTGRDEALVLRIEAYAKAQGLVGRLPTATKASTTPSSNLIFPTVEPSLAGPKTAGAKNVTVTSTGVFQSCVQRSAVEPIIFGCASGRVM